MSAEAKPVGVGFGIILMLVGLAMMVLMASNRSSLDVPLWVGEVAMSTFTFAGASFVGQSLKWKRFTRICSLAVVYALSVPGLYLLFSSGSLSCTSSLGNGYFGINELATADMGCRIMFGLGGVFTLIFAMAMSYVALVKPRS